MIGQLLKERYQVTEKLGQGGQAITYKAKDTQGQNQIRVVKHLCPTSTNPTLSEAAKHDLWETAKELFGKEAKALAGLGHHPQIPGLLEDFVENGEFYLVQEFIEGQPLSVELPSGQRWSETQVIQLLHEILSILEFVHSKGVIHRDIKPDNIIRRRLDNKLVLVDFGAVKLERQLAQVSAKSRRSVSVGTLGYMPSEQQDGKPVFASDLYALGMISIQALTGKNAADLVLHHKKRGEIDWQPLVTVSKELTEVLTGIVRCFPEDRYQSAEEVLQALNPNGSKINNGGYTPTEIVSEPPKVPPDYRTERVEQPPKIQDWRCIHHLTGHVASVRSVAISPDSQTLVSAGDDNTVKVWHLNSGVSGSLKNTFKPQTGFFKGEATYFTSVAISPEGQILASGCLDKTIKLWHLNNGNWIRDLKGHSDSVYSVAISPDSQTLVSAGRENTIKVWNLPTGQALRNLTGHSDSVYAVAISPDSQTLVSASRDNTIKVWNLLNGKLLNTFTGHIDWVHCVAISPDGQTIVSGSKDNTIRLWNIGSGQLIRTLNGHSNWVTSVAISPDGSTLISGSRDKTIKLWNLDNGELIATLTGHLELVWCVVISPDGKSIASSSDDGAIKIWQRN
ncbi:MAG: serine/threonine-protein kinase [Tychonema bourrellyi B0820]|nr:serine/threonine-protein kinase [Tychonema bourrellyi]MDQ2099286.1 serine/threonine-protein kinase [Tychonema bourrellyi B0820]